DYTDYFETLPANALERALFLEADRMRRPRLTEENLINQVDVVKEEIRVNVLNRPYGGFPWLRLPPVMFDTFPNAHDGYGSFGDLDSATVADAADLASERREAFEDRLAPLPAVASAWRVPDPIGDLRAYLPYVVLAEVLTDGDASRLVERLVLRDRVV